MLSKRLLSRKALFITIIVSKTDGHSDRQTDRQTVRLNCTKVSFWLTTSYSLAQTHLQISNDANFEKHACPLLQSRNTLTISSRKKALQCQWPDCLSLSTFIFQKMRIAIEELGDQFEEPQLL